MAMTFGWTKDEIEAALDYFDFRPGESYHADQLLVHFNLPTFEETVDYSTRATAYASVNKWQINKVRMYSTLNKQLGKRGMILKQKMDTNTIYVSSDPKQIERLYKNGKQKVKRGNDLNAGQNLVAVLESFTVLSETSPKAKRVVSTPFRPTDLRGFRRL